MPWVYLLLAGLLEICWAFAMKASYGFSRPLPTVVMLVCMVASFGLLSVAMRTLPLGTAYAIWTGIGAVGAFLVGILLLGESASPLRLLAAGLIVAGLALMKVSSAA
ncbi:DMT family transporter [Mangrovicoccus algicola]|uniref:Guanidinium exporter n=1 Tax=Mangrovicoccus algicola TaxID=2771008 RepID=A0A8J6YQX1_9RHOB|nr:multidrug efflux SMR transporter [Mangrovicoccus algicola]MBE3637938.1 multidrug efflux SMR transporter [Mangrovicoccus algicola]